MLGEEEFLEAVLTKTGLEPAEKPGIDAVIEAVEAIYGMTKGSLAHSGRSFKSAEARSMAAWAVRGLSDTTLTQLGQMLDRDVTTLSSSIGRMLLRAKSDKEVAMRLDRLRACQPSPFILSYQWAICSASSRVKGNRSGLRFSSSTFL